VCLGVVGLKKGESKVGNKKTQGGGRGKKGERGKGKRGIGYVRERRVSLKGVHHEGGGGRSAEEVKKG